MMLVNSAESVNTNPATYKLFMADTSQVYCGRSLPKHKKNDVADDNKIGLASLLAASYRPARTRRPNIVPRDDGDDLAKTALHRRSSTESDSSMSTSTDDSSGSGSSRRRSSTTSADGGGMMRRRNSTGGGGGGGPTLRRKCQPLHRDQSFNQSVSSIMRPSRYSMTSSTHSLSSELNDSSSSLHSSNQAPTAPTPRRRISRRATLDGLPAQSMMHSDLSRETYHRSNSLDDQWVASGVDFSSSVEVYVFRK